MCGIAGWVSYERNLAESARIVDLMTDSMERRGPDGRGTFIDRHGALGHRRLSVIDIDGGAQPMARSVAGTNVSITYSGEVYNYRELRDELARRGHKFQTSSDTEVVLAAYLEWGDAMASRLNGMYGFAVWDGRDDTLLMVRDRAGVKPFYYFETEDGVLFGSEPKAILANPLGRREVALDGFRELFSFGKTPGAGVWAGMKELEPGTHARVSRRGIRTTRYWSLDTQPHEDDVETTVGKIHDLLHDIVGRELISDVPICTLLSGGLDSSALTTIAAAQRRAEGRTLQSYSVDFVGLEDNFVSDPLRMTPDTPFIRDVVSHAGTDHRDVVLTSAELADPSIRRAVIEARDFPSGLGDLDLSLYLFMREMRPEVTVALTGESADELFGGYRQFFDPAAHRSLTFPWLANGHQFFGRSADGTVPTSLLLPDFEKQLDLEAFVDESYESAVSDIVRLDGESDFEWTMRKINYLHLTRFVKIWLDRKDRIPMAFGLEVRVPFSDHRLVEYVYNSPWSMKTFDGKEKSLLRSGAADLLPSSVIERRKVPYPTTQDPSYATGLRDQGRELLTNANHQVFDIVDRGALAGSVASEDSLVDQASRRELERVLDLAIWIDCRQPSFTL